MPPSHHHVTARNDLAGPNAGKPDAPSTTPACTLPLPPDVHFLTVREVGDLLRLRSRTLDSWRLRGYGPPFIQLSQHDVRYSRAGLEQWLAEREAETRARTVASIPLAQARAYRAILRRRHT